MYDLVLRQAITSDIPLPLTGVGAGWSWPGLFQSVGAPARFPDGGTPLLLLLLLGTGRSGSWTDGNGSAPGATGHHSGFARWVPCNIPAVNRTPSYVLPPIYVFYDIYYDVVWSQIRKLSWCSANKHTYVWQAHWSINNTWFLRGTEKFSQSEVWVFLNFFPLNFIMTFRLNPWVFLLLRQLCFKALGFLSSNLIFLFIPTKQASLFLTYLKPLIQISKSLLWNFDSYRKCASLIDN